MKESHRKDPASRPDPESCVDDRKVAGEALTGAHAGQPSSCEIRSSGVPTPLSEAEGHTEGGDLGEPPSDPAQSKTLSMRENSLHGNREIPRTSAGDEASRPDGLADRPEKVGDRTSGMHVRGKSDDRVVPKKPSNNDSKSSGTESAETAEGRRSTKGNADPQATPRTQSRTRVSSSLISVRLAARRDRRARFTALLHHVTLDRLRESFHALKRNAAAGVDGMTWQQYEVELEIRLMDLHRRVHQGTYRASPSRRVHIPKADGRLRPLGIATLEDKIVQQVVVWVLSQIYEVDFLGFSYGFRPGRSQHDALDALSTALTRKKVNWVLDADIQGFFDSIELGWLQKFLEHRIADRRMLRLIQKWLTAGVSEDGRWSKSEAGVPQGAVISPILANVYLHYAFDLWVQQWRSKHCKGEAIVVRYADDFLVGFQHRGEAERFLGELRERLRKFGLALHPEKTRLLEFGRFAAANRRRRGESKPETFDFLGFTHVCTRSKAGTMFLVRRLSMKKRLRAKLREVRQTLHQQRHRPIPEQGAWLRSVVQGYFNYHAIAGNRAALEAFRLQSARAWLFALRRRSQRARMPWSRFAPILDRWIPKPKVLHPHPDARFDAKHPR
jgi:RNA-directed DNA polymerase